MRSRTRSAGVFDGRGGGIAAHCRTVMAITHRPSNELRKIVAERKKVIDLYIIRGYNCCCMTRERKHPLLAFREANGHLSQAEAAAQVGITQAHWSRLEAGKSHCRPRVAKRIAALTGVSLECLLGLSDNEPDLVSMGTRTGARENKP